MINVSTCVGDYAKVPYCFQNLGINVYCMEELCYCIRENAFLLDTELMSDTLVNWIGRDCALSDLAKELHVMVHEKGSLSQFAAAIIRYVGFYKEEIISQVEQTLKKGAGLSYLEKRKTRLDYLTGKKKYTAAIRGYGDLLEEWDKENSGLPPGAAAGKNEPAPVVTGRCMKASLLHNRGTAFAGLMRYDKAAEDFRQAYDTDKSQDSLICYLAALRLSLKEEDYIARVAEMKDCFDASLKLEQQLKQIEEDWHSDVDYLRFKQRENLRHSGNRQNYYEDSERLIQALKESYRCSID